VLGTALVSVLAPAAALLILFFGGGTVNSCLGGSGCVPATIPNSAPVLGRDTAPIAGLVICATAWLVAAVALIVHVVCIDAARLLRAGLAVAMVALGAATVGFVVGAQHRLRQGAEDAALYGIGGLVVAFVVALAWAGITARPAADTQPKSTGGGPP
jgi:hypothetical protein